MMDLVLRTHMIGIDQKGVGVQITIIGEKEGMFALVTLG